MSELELFARLIQCEAGGEGDNGMRAVASVVMNRVRSGRYGSIMAVIYAPGQFGVVSNGSIGRYLSNPKASCRQAAQEAINGIKSIPCTACHYCTSGCPRQIPIPEIFAARNRQLVWGHLEEGRRAYAATVQHGGRASDCVACGQCVKACPQQIPVIDWLKDCAAQFD